MSKSLIATLVIIGAVLCASCGTDVGTASTQKPVADAAHVETGKDGVKAANGGGMTPQPEEPKPGEHIGAPGPGAKSTGG